MKYREIVRKLQALGCIELPRRSGGSHRKWTKLGTLRAVVRQLGLEWEAFEKA